MLKFFRKIRQKLVAENRFSKYLIYAIGEIVLVVIGILIALQINNWNQTKKNRNKELEILRDLKVEFKMNKLDLEALISDHQGMLNATNKIMELIGKSDSTLEEHNIDSLLYLSIDYDDFNPKQSIIDESISSGTISLIRNDSLRSLIFVWKSMKEDLDETYRTMDEMSQTITLPYLAENGSMKNIDFYGILSSNGKSNFESKNPALFREVSFENVMDNQAWGLTNYLSKLKETEMIVDEIIRHTDNQINKAQ